MNKQDIIDALSTFNGCTFAGLDQETTPKLNKTIPAEGGRVPNPLNGKTVKKITKGLNVMLFRDETNHAYTDMVRRRLSTEGINPENFNLNARSWGKRIENSPFVENAKTGELYLQYISQAAGQTHYTVDGVVTPESEITGLPKKSKPLQAGLKEKVIVRTVKISNITGIRVSGQSL